MQITEKMINMYNNNIYRMYIDKYPHYYRVVIKSRGPGIFPGY